ncbi:hypothetical protein CONCODRAFT_80073 [Conidiobolus coronatus NRRL 28638]|uniref:Uncharacterized protein n=1 Tax=Conidiobolus coronatus (strain ATCC 28846 / CBS 209.66 / NRRL 28638) TaxID=796925 RepID=A0A137NY69_CONC2|nr:hypothetical protein CONCODRAFT_80073 [Conidiobolus coronatus NRRL 28638]|eukprot:KXN67611.1 hypothetical protein CONCODRAFT_80073 [Conidiobolus coronatus NRRL 28638]
MTITGFLITVACRSSEIILACILILSSNAVYYTHSKLIQRFFFAFLTWLNLNVRLLPAKVIIKNF